MKIQFYSLFISILLVSTISAQKNIGFRYEPSGDGVFFSGTMTYYPNVMGGLEFRVIISEIQIEAIRYKGTKYDDRYFSVPNQNDIKGTIYFSGSVQHGRHVTNGRTTFNNCGITIELSKNTTTANMLQDNGSAYFSEAITDNYFADKTALEKDVKSDVYGGGANWVKYWKENGYITDLTVSKIMNLHVRGTNNTSVFDYLKDQIVEDQLKDEFYNLRLQLSDYNRDDLKIEDYETALKLIESSKLKFKEDDYQKELDQFKKDITSKMDKLRNSSSNTPSNGTNSGKSSSSANSNKKEEEEKSKKVVPTVTGSHIDKYEYRDSYSGVDNYQNSYQEEQQRIIRENQQRYERNMKAMESASRQFEKDMKQIINSNISYSQFNEKIEGLTRLSKSNDPHVIIREYEAKMRELERTYDKRLQEKINEINRETQELKNDNNPLAESAGALSKTLAQNNIRKQKEESERELKREKRALLEEILNNQVAGYERNEKSFRLKAAASPELKMEKYYLEMADYYQCCREHAEDYFSIESTTWLYPDCDVPSKVKGRSAESIPSKELFEASKRKRNSSNPSDQEYADDFLDMAIKQSPSNSEYLYERSTYYNLGSNENLVYLAKATQLSPGNSRYREEYLYSLALNKQESAYFAVYLKSYPKGRHYAEAKKKYDYYIDKEAREAVYNRSIVEINGLMKKGELPQARQIYLSIKDTEFFQTSDIQNWRELEEYLSYREAIDSSSSSKMINHLKKYSNEGVWNPEVKKALKPTLMREAESYIKNEKYSDAIKTLNLYKNYFPNDEDEKKISEMLEISHQGRQSELIAYADLKMRSKDWKAASNAFQSYLTEYPSGSRSAYARSMYKKANNKYQISLVNGFYWAYSFSPSNTSVITGEHFFSGFGIYYGIRVGGLFIKEFYRYEIDERGRYVYDDNIVTSNGYVVESYPDFPTKTTSLRDLNKTRYSSIMGCVGVNYPITPVLWAYGGVGLGLIETYRRHEMRTETDYLYGTVESSTEEIWIKDLGYSGFKFTFESGIKLVFDSFLLKAGISTYPGSVRFDFGLGINMGYY